MSQYHDTHYGFFHFLLPMMLRSEMFDQFVEASEEGSGHAMMVGFWRTTARQVSGVGATGVIPAELDLTRDAFSVQVAHPAPGTTFLVMTGPPVRNPLEVSCSVGAFADRDPAATFRYFTCEAPMESNLPWMVGEWLPDGSRNNLGPIMDPTPSGMENFVAGILGAPVASNNLAGGARPRDIPGVRAIPDVDELLKGRQGSKSQDLTNGTIGRGVIGGGQDRIGAGGSPSAPDGAQHPHTSGGSHIPVVTGPLTSIANWDASPAVLAAETVSNLYRVRASDGSAMVMSARKAKGLGKKTSSYVQFMWNNDDSLIVELQADYSYWGLSIPSSAWPLLDGAGLLRPDGTSANFHLLIPADATHGDRLHCIERVFAAFINVLQPSGKVELSSF